MSETTAGEVYLAALGELIEAEGKRRESLEGRAITVISVSGTLVTLLLALSAFARGRDATLQDAGAAKVLVVCAAVSFAVATASAIGTYAPSLFRPVDVPGMQDQVFATWDETPDWARQKVSADRLLQLDDLQRTNNRKGAFLLSAVLAQLVATTLVAVAVGLALAG